MNPSVFMRMSGAALAGCFLSNLPFMVLNILDYSGADGFAAGVAEIFLLAILMWVMAAPLVSAAAATAVYAGLGKPDMGADGYKRLRRRAFVWGLMCNFLPAAWAVGAVGLPVFALIFVLTAMGWSVRLFRPYRLQPA